jgi:hypothetical protein
LDDKRGNTKTPGDRRYLRRRPRIINTAPVSKASAVAPDAGSISGDRDWAKQRVDMPSAMSAIPPIFIIKLLFILPPFPDETFLEYGGSAGDCQAQKAPRKPFQLVC